MWPTDYTDRLRSWVDLRNRAAHMDWPPALLAINDWWMRSPWRPYYLHWDDRETWPDAWQLLADDCYCDLARALGIVYTLHMSRPADVSRAEIVDTDQGNLVSIDAGKYILNWAPGRILNIQSTNLAIKRTISAERISMSRDVT